MIEDMSSKEKPLLTIEEQYPRFVSSTVDVHSPATVESYPEPELTPTFTTTRPSAAAVEFLPQFFPTFKLGPRHPEEILSFTFDFL
jgi:hypothetical protein